MKDVSLFSWRRKDQATLDVVVDEIAATLDGAVAFALTPTRAIFATLNNNRLHAIREEALAGAFEARVFNSSHELRWWHPPDAPDGVGVAIVLTETESQPPDGWKRDDPRSVGALDNRYLLWGTAAASLNAGWSTLLEARIGSLDVPLDALADGVRVALKTVEYVTAIDEHGNRDVVEERLVELKPTGAAATSASNGA